MRIIIEKGIVLARSSVMVSLELLAYIAVCKMSNRHVHDGGVSECIVFFVSLKRERASSVMSSFLFSNLI